MTTPTGSKPKSALIVDDETIIADTLRLILVQSGFHAATAYDGQAALEKARQMNPDILLCDVVMPGLNGIELAIQIRSFLPRCRVLLLSGQAAVHDLLEDARLRGHHFDLLTKPVHPDELLDFLRADPR